MLIREQSSLAFTMKTWAKNRWTPSQVYAINSFKENCIIFAHSFPLIVFAIVQITNRADYFISTNILFKEYAYERIRFQLLEWKSFWFSMKMQNIQEMCLLIAQRLKKGASNSRPNVISNNISVQIIIICEMYRFFVLHSEVYVCSLSKWMANVAHTGTKKNRGDGRE